jgi:hypothetical protein
VKALTLTQPWASLVMAGVKRIETRSWPVPLALRQPGARIVVHASKGWTSADRQFAADLMARGVLPERWVTTARGSHHADLPLGVALGTVRLDGMGTTTTIVRVWELTDLERELGDYSLGRYGWLLADPEPFPEPVPCKGALGLWEYRA